MLKLLTAFIDNPSLKTAAKVKAYAAKHPMSLCMLSAEEAAHVRSAMAYADRA